MVTEVVTQKEETILQVLGFSEDLNFPEPMFRAWRHPEGYLLKVNKVCGRAFLKRLYSKETLARFAAAGVAADEEELFIEEEHVDEMMGELVNMFLESREDDEDDEDDATLRQKAINEVPPGCRYCYCILHR